jgi:hypothetical protein
MTSAAAVLNIREPRPGRIEHTRDAGKSTLPRYAGAPKSRELLALGYVIAEIGYRYRCASVPHSGMRSAKGLNN